MIFSYLLSALVERQFMLEAEAISAVNWIRWAQGARKKIIMARTGFDGYTAVDFPKTGVIGARRMNFLPNRENAMRSRIPNAKSNNAHDACTRSRQFAHKFTNKFRMLKSVTNIIHFDWDEIATVSYVISLSDKHWVCQPRNFLLFFLYNPVLGSRQEDDKNQL